MPPGQEAPGRRPFQTQYTDEALRQLKRLDEQLSITVQEKVRVIAASDPYAHGAPDSRTNHRDRRIVVIDGLLVTFWIIEPLRILTVVDIYESRGGPCEPVWPDPSGSAEVSRPAPFTEEDDGEDDGEVYMEMAATR